MAFGGGGGRKKEKGGWHGHVRTLFTASMNSSSRSSWKLNVLSTM